MQKIFTTRRPSGAVERRMPCPRALPGVIHNCRASGTASPHPRRTCSHAHLGQCLRYVHPLTLRACPHAHLDRYLRHGLLRILDAHVATHISIDTSGTASFVSSRSVHVAINASVSDFSLLNMPLGTCRHAHLDRYFRPPYSVYVEESACQPVIMGSCRRHGVRG